MSEIEGSGSDETISNLAQARIAEIRAKMPAGAHAEDFFEVLRGEVAERARALALSLIKDTEAGDAAH
jgi:hypothetical protein